MFSASGLPEQSMAALRPSLWLNAMTSSSACGEVGSTVRSAPSSVANRRRSSIGSRATTRAPNALAASMPAEPIGPMPQMPTLLAPETSSFLQAL